MRKSGKKKRYPKHNHYPFGKLPDELIPEVWLSNIELHVLENDPEILKQISDSLAKILLQNYLRKMGDSYE